MERIIGGALVLQKKTFYTATTHNLKWSKKQEKFVKNDLKNNEKI